MKFRAKVTGARVDGDALVIGFQSLDGMGWRPVQTASFSLDNTKTTREAMYVGREVDIEITPRRAS